MKILEIENTETQTRVWLENDGIEMEYPLTKDPVIGVFIDNRNRHHIVDIFGYSAKHLITAKRTRDIIKFVKENA